MRTPNRVSMASDEIEDEQIGKRKTINSLSAQSAAARVEENPFRKKKTQSNDEQVLNQYN